MATTTVVSGNATKNNGATIVKAGNVPSSATRVTNVQTLLENAVKLDVNTVIASSGTNIGTHGPIVGGTFGYNPPSNVSSSTPLKVVAKRVSTTLSGKSDTSLQSGAADTSARKSIAEWKGDRLYNNTNAAGATFDLFTGTLTTGTTTLTAGTLVAPSGISGEVNSDADHAVKNTTFAIPGELVLMETGGTPSQKDYAAKYST